MAEEKKITRRITLHVYDLDIPVTIPVQEEEYYRDGAKMITDLVNAYSAKFKGTKPEKEILYMTLIDIALRYQKERSRNDVMPFDEILSKLTSEIEEALK